MSGAPAAGRARDGDARRPRPSGALLLAGACVLAMAAVWALADLLPAARSADVHLLGDLTRLRDKPLEDVLQALVDLLSPGLYLLWFALIVALALARGRKRLAIAAGAVMVLAPLSAELLKRVVALHHEQIGTLGVEPGSWPSGHASAALALALSAALVAPARAKRAVAVLGCLLVLVLGCALLILEEHMLSDVIGGYLLATLWASSAVAALRAAGRRWPARD